MNEMNPNLARLIDLLGRSMKPSHGYTIAEGAPEVVTAPGVYFPAEKGEVLPLQSRQFGGDVEPLDFSQMGTRPNGSPKGMGYFGPLKLPDGRTATEISIGVNIGGKDMEIPTLVPTLKDEEVNHLLGGGKPTKEIVDKAVEHAKKRILEGKNPFAQEGEQTPLMFSRQKGGSVDPAMFTNLLRNMFPSMPINKVPYNERTSAYGSPPGPSMFSNQGNTLLPTPKSYEMKPETLKEPELDLWQKKKKEAGWRDPTQDLWEHKREEGGWSTPMFSRANGGAVTPTEEDEIERLLRLKKEIEYQGQGIPTPSLSTSPEDTLRKGMKVGPERWFVGEREVTPGAPGAISGEELAKTRLPMVTDPELEARGRWEQPGYAEKMTKLGIIPGYERSYYEAHPEERLMDIEAERMRPLEQTMLKAIEDERTRQQGYGLGFGPTPAEIRRGVGRRREPSQMPELLAGLSRIVGGRGVTTPRVSQPRLPSLGNVAEIAISRKFQDPSYLTDPEKNAQALKWLATEEGVKTLTEVRDTLVPPGITFLQTGEGFIPAVTRGAGAGTIGAPTGFGRPLTSEMITFEGQANQIRQGLETVKTLYNTVTEDTKIPQGKGWIGPVAGRIGGAKEKLIGVPEDQATFYSKLTEIANVIVYLYSGKQINENEYKRLMASLPTRDLPESTFEARMKAFEKTLSSITEGRKKGMGGYGKQTPSPTTPSPTRREIIINGKRIIVED